MIGRTADSIIKQTFKSFSLSYSISLIYFYEQTNSLSLAVLILRIQKLLPISLHAIPIFSAVSNLSPVSIQILIPEFLRSAIVSGTSVCKQSSTAVAPSTYKSYSNSLYNSHN